MGLVASITCALPACAERVALVIGVTDYKSLPDVPGAATDASNIAAALTNIDFEVTVVTNPSHDGLAPLLASFSERVAGAETVVVYFAGHGIQHDGTNYLVPGDASLTTAAELADETWPLDPLLETVIATGRWPSYQTLVFLDTSHELSLPVADATGLAVQTPPRGVFLSSAAQPGAVAIPPETGDRSLFAAALLGHLDTEGISIADMMARVRGEVVRLTDERQIPWARSNLTTQVYLRPVVEEGTVITAADLETWGSLDEESRARLIAALGRNGVLLEIVDIEEEEEDTTDVASLTPEIGEIGLIIEDIDALDLTARPPLDTGFQDTPETVASLGPAPDAAPEQAATTDTVSAVESAVEAATDTRPASKKIEDLVKQSTGAEAVTTTETTTQAATVPDPDIELPENLALAVQQELTRVGCHRAAVDGLWGKVSTVSLLRYYAQRGEVTEEQAKGQPTAAAFALLRAEEGIACQGVIAPQVRTASARSAPKKTTKVVVRKAATAPKTTQSSSGSTSSSKKRIQPTVTRSQTGEKRTIKRLNTGQFR